MYLGSALLIIATLHCGVQFGWNVHTLAYALLYIVIFSAFSVFRRHCRTNSTQRTAIAVTRVQNCTNSPG